MKRIIFSDVHGNDRFLDAMLKAAEAEKPDSFYFLGDCVSYYPEGRAVIRRLQEIGAVCVEGNHDSMLRGEFPIPEQHEPVYRLRRVMAEILPEELDFVKSWPEVRDEVIGGLRVEFVHGSPLNHLKGYAYADSELGAYDSPDRDIVFCGHTHRPWMRRNGHTLMVNVGSVGLPRDEGNGCRPCYALWDTEKAEVVLKRVDADPAYWRSRPDRVHESVLKALSR